jgi:dimethylhistidine N-methyltransferase
MAVLRYKIGKGCLIYSSYKMEKSKIISEVYAGLKQVNKYLPSKYFYDETGSVLFDKICTLDEYYLTRTEIGILKKNIKEIASLLGENNLILELGSGSCSKIKFILDNFKNISAYIPVDISREHLFASAKKIEEEYPELDIYPVAADFNNFQMPKVKKSYDKTLIFYPGSSIGNFHPEEAKTFLTNTAAKGKKDTYLLIGVDLKKDKKIIETAYNDLQGVTGEFNLNVLRRLNRELNADFDIDEFSHKAFYDEKQGRIEMQLISRSDQSIKINGGTIKFKKNEAVTTEYSYKYTVEEFSEVLKGNFELIKFWIDKRQLFSVQLYYFTGSSQ